MKQKLLLIGGIVLVLFLMGISILELGIIATQRMTINNDIVFRASLFEDYGEVKRKNTNLFVENARLSGMITDACNTLARTSWDIEKLVNQLNCKGIIHESGDSTSMLVP